MYVTDLGIEWIHPWIGLDCWDDCDLVL